MRTYNDWHPFLSPAEVCKGIRIFSGDKSEMLLFQGGSVKFNLCVLESVIWKRFVPCSKTRVWHATRATQKTSWHCSRRNNSLRARLNTESYVIDRAKYFLAKNKSFQTKIIKNVCICRLILQEFINAESLFFTKIDIMFYYLSLSIFLSWIPSSYFCQLNLVVR
jgi:hypothetical protein